MAEVTVFIIAEHAPICALLARGLAAQPNLSVVGSTSNPVAGAELARLAQPNIMIVGLNRVGWGRVETCSWLRRMSPRSRVVVLTSYLEEGEEERFLAAGASSCLLSGISVKELATELLKLAAEDALGDGSIPAAAIRRRTIKP